MTSAVATIIHAVSPVSILGAGAGATDAAAAGAGATVSSAITEAGTQNAANVRSNAITAKNFTPVTFMVHSSLFDDALFNYSACDNKQGMCQRKSRQGMMKKALIILQDFIPHAE
jgi:hypothetical protein